MGFNQHTRGVWANNPALQPPSADRKLPSPAAVLLADRPAPSACGTAREVGTFHTVRSADMVVTTKTP